MGERVAELVFELAQRKTDSIVRILKAQGKTVEVSDGQITVRDNQGFTCALLIGSQPVDGLIQVMFALFGPMWSVFVPDIYETASKIIHRVVCEQIKQVKARKR